jgi:hypothetical protein
MKLVFHAVKKMRRHGSVAEIRLPYISSCVIASGSAYVKDKLPACTSRTLTRRTIVTGARKSRSAKVVTMIDFSFASICRLQTKYIEKAMTVKSIMTLKTAVPIQRASTRGTSPSRYIQGCRRSPRNAMLTMELVPNTRHSVVRTRPRYIFLDSLASRLKRRETESLLHQSEKRKRMSVAYRLCSLVG